MGKKISDEVKTERINLSITEDLNRAIREKSIYSGYPIFTDWMRNATFKKMLKEKKKKLSNLKNQPRIPKKQLAEIETLEYQIGEIERQIEIQNKYALQYWGKANLAQKRQELKEYISEYEKYQNTYKKFHGDIDRNAVLECEEKKREYEIMKMELTIIKKDFVIAEIHQIIARYQNDIDILKKQSRTTRSAARNNKRASKSNRNALLLEEYEDELREYTNRLIRLEKLRKRNIMHYESAVQKM